MIISWNPLELFSKRVRPTVITPRYRRSHGGHFPSTTRPLATVTSFLPTRWSALCSFVQGILKKGRSWNVDFGECWFWNFGKFAKKRMHFLWKFLLSFLLLLLWLLSLSMLMWMWCCGVWPPRCIVSQIAGAVMFGAVSKGRWKFVVYVHRTWWDIQRHLKM